MEVCETFALERPDDFRNALVAEGAPRSGEYSVALAPQFVDAGTLVEVEALIQVFDRVTTRESWRTAALAEAPASARISPGEVCFFSAWDFHLPLEGGAWLIEFNDNGSGFLYAAIINALFYDAAGLAREPRIAQPATVPVFHDRIGSFVDGEAKAFFGARPDGLALVLDDKESLAAGKFRGEHKLLAALLAERGWEAAIGAPDETRFEGRRLIFHGRPVVFVVNRSTDFFWSSGPFDALRAARAERAVYVAPNPFTYATRSDKGLLWWLSSPDRDAEFGIEPEERRVLSAHVPETRLLAAAGIDELADRKAEFVFKPRRGFAGGGLLDSAAIGHARLRRLLRGGEEYVAQRRIDKGEIEIDGRPLWTDLRVWAYRGEILLVSGRASRRPDRLDLSPPGGWIPTYALR
jgi:hypothetical protein